MTSAAVGRRESKRRETRDALVASAMRLFAKNGYQATTVAAIAADAGVSPRTFFGYFPTKEAVLFAPIEAVIADIELQLQDADGTAFDIIRSWAVDHEAWFTQQLPALHTLLNRAVSENDSLAIAALGFVERVAMAVARRLRAELGSEPDDTVPEMAALSTVVAFAVAMPTRAGGHQPGAVAAAGARVLSDLDTAICFARAGIEATRPRPPQESTHS